LRETFPGGGNFSRKGAKGRDGAGLDRRGVANGMREMRAA